MALAFLNGIRILDLSQFLPGPFATQMLSDMGADVVKVEPPKGDPMRGLDPITNDRGDNPYHALVNAGKRVVTLDLKSQVGIDSFTDLVKSADVLMESYRPGVMERLGFGQEVLRKINPRLVHCALPGFGQNGPMRLVGGHDINYVAASGQLGMSGTVEKPHMAYPMVADYAGAMQSVCAILGALVGRGLSGQGAYLDVAMSDSVLAWQSQALTAMTRGHTLGREQNLLTGGAACYCVYETADNQFVSLGALEDVFWKNFCDAVGRPELIERQSEPLPQTGLISDVAAIFKTKTRDDWDDVFRDVDCCYHPVLQINEVTGHPQNATRRLIQPQGGLEDAHGISVLLPFWTNGEPPTTRSPVVMSSVDDIFVSWKTT